MSRAIAANRHKRLKNVQILPIKILAYEREYFLLVSLNKNCLNLVSTCSLVRPLLSLGENLSTFVFTALRGWDLKYFIILSLSKAGCAAVAVPSDFWGCGVSPGKKFIWTFSFAFAAAVSSFEGSSVGRASSSFTGSSIFSFFSPFLSLTLKNIFIIKPCLILSVFRESHYYFYLILPSLFQWGRGTACGG